MNRFQHWVPEPRSMPKQVNRYRKSYEEGGLTSVTEVSQVSLAMDDVFNPCQRGPLSELHYTSIGSMIAYIGAMGASDYYTDFGRSTLI